MMWFIAKKFCLVGLCLVWVGFAGCAPVPKRDMAAVPAGQYVLDRSHASVVFLVDHGGGLSKFVGRFDGFDAALTFDPQRPDTSRLDAVIEAASINTGMADFDGQLANHGALFDARRHPQMRFVTRQVVLSGENTAQVTGDFTMRGQTHPLTLDVTFNGSARDVLRGNRQVVGFSATAVLDRTVWGADAYVNFGVGREVSVMIEAEFMRE